MRHGIIDSLKHLIIQSFTGWCASIYHRLFPEIFAESFDAFESGPIEKYRKVQPAVIAASHLARAFE